MRRKVLSIARLAVDTVTRLGLPPETSPLKLAG
jgi:hypothetical protein